MPRRSDAKTLEPSALHLLHRQVVRAVRGGMSQTDAAHTFGASLRTVSTWRRLDREGGLRAFTLKRRGRHPGATRLSGQRAAVVRLYLRAWGLSPQKPVRHANERNEAAIAWWLKQEYPAIAQ